MLANSTRLMVWEGGVEVTIIFMRVSEAGCVEAAPRGDEQRITKQWSIANSTYDGYRRMNSLKRSKLFHSPTIICR
jgi:hypothetical protein